jgi:hypothetical protein
MGSLAIGYLQVVQPLTDELKWDEARFGLVARTNRVDRHFLRNPDKWLESEWLSSESWGVS